MYTLQIEHKVKDFTLWKAAFDRDPLDRAGSGVLRFRVSQPVNEADYVVVELEFESLPQAADMLRRLQESVWSSSSSAPALLGAPQTRIVESVYAGVPISQAS